MEGASNDATAQMTAIGKTIQILFCLPRSVVNVNLTQHSTISVAHKQSLGYKIRKSKLEAISSSLEVERAKARRPGPNFYFLLNKL